VECSKLDEAARWGCTEDFIEDLEESGDVRDFSSDKAFAGIEAAQKRWRVSERESESSMMSFNERGKCHTQGARWGYTVGCWGSY
jgi:hypothetical protein